MEIQALQWLRQNSRLNPVACQSLAGLAPRLALRLNQTSVRALAIAGPPGSGKSTLAGMLAHVLTDSGRAATVLSLDDFYLSRARREELEAGRYPLLARRGVPGTHDWPQFLRIFDALKEGHIENLHLPVFNKSTDDVEPLQRWRQVTVPPALLIIEGWCIGAPPQQPSSLAPAINSVERALDPECSWRHFVNQRLADYRADLQTRIDQFWYLSVPDWSCVVDWRWQQEQELALPLLKSREDVQGFLATFERTVRHMQSSSPEWADCLLACDYAHRTSIVR